MVVASFAAMVVAVAGVALRLNREPAQRLQTAAGGQPIATDRVANPTTTMALATTTMPAAPLPAPAPPAGGPVPAGFAPRSVTYVSTAEGWVLGTAPCGSPPCTSIVRTTDGGSSWAGIPAPRTDGVRFLRFATELDGWAFGPDLWSTHDGGAHWKQQPYGLSAGSAPIVALEAASGVAYALNGRGTLMRTEVGQDDWQTVKTLRIPVVNQGSIVLQGRAAWVLASGAGSNDATASEDGLTWRTLDPPCDTPVLAASSPTEVVVSCQLGSAAGSQRKSVYVSHDAGATFRRVTDAPLGGIMLSIASADRSTIVMAATSGASFLYASFDGGETWSTVLNDSTGGAPLIDLGFTTPVQGVVVEGQAGPKPGIFYRTTDGGHTWSATPFTP